MNGTTARLQGLGGYGELWLWLVGDDRLLPEPGYELPVRLRQLPERPGGEGLMVAVRGDFIKEDFTSTLPAVGDPNTATTRVIAVSAAVNYWYSRRVRVSANYVANILGGTSETIKAAAAPGSLEHELLLRFAMSL